MLQSKYKFCSKTSKCFNSFEDYTPNEKQKKMYIWICDLYKSNTTDENSSNRITYEDVLGTQYSRALLMPDDLDRKPKSDKERAFRYMWVLLNQHKWQEAARLFCHCLHLYTVGSSWIWRVCYHILCAMHRHASMNLLYPRLYFTSILDRTNMNLEYVLQCLNRGEFHKVSEIREVKENRSMAIHKRSRFEPELDLVARLIRLYEGVAYYALWLRVYDLRTGRTMDEDFSGQSYLTEAICYAERAVVAFQELDIVVENGQICDIFMTKYVELLLFLHRGKEAESILQRYYSNCPTNPNTCRYLAEFYRSQCTFDPVLAEEEDWVVDELVWATRFQEKTLPACPGSWRLNESLFGCIQRNIERNDRKKDALYLLFGLLDYPAWKKEERPWNMLASLVADLGADSEIVDLQWRLRASWWPKCQFRADDGSKLPNHIQQVKDLLIV